MKTLTSTQTLETETRMYIVIRWRCWTLLTPDIFSQITCSASNKDSLWCYFARSILRLGIWMEKDTSRKTWPTTFCSCKSRLKVIKGPHLLCSESAMVLVTTHFLYSDLSICSLQFVRSSAIATNKAQGQLFGGRGQLILAKTAFPSLMLSSAV